METENLIIVPELVYTPDAAAKRLGISSRWLQQDRTGKRLLAHIKIGHFVRYRGADMLEFLDANRVGGAA